MIKFLAILLTGLLVIRGAAAPQLRVVPKGFDASQADITAILTSTGQALWQYFPEAQLEPIVIVRGHQGPITLFERNARGEIIVKLDTHKTYWSQYAYQWAHELCHILANFKNDGRENKWFEETLCEVASLFAIRQMSKTWEHSPPYPNWKNYRHALGNYAKDIIDSREKLTLKQLASYYQTHRGTLRKSSTERTLNGAIALALLPLFEEEPTRWEAIAYLNTTPASKGITLTQYFAKWRNDAPPKHQPFIRTIARYFVPSAQ